MGSNLVGPSQLFRYAASTNCCSLLLFTLDRHLWLSKVAVIYIWAKQGSWFGALSMGVNDKPKAAANAAQEIQLVLFRELGKWDSDCGDLYWVDVAGCVTLCRRGESWFCWATRGVWQGAPGRDPCACPRWEPLHETSCTSLREGFWEPPRCADTEDVMTRALWFSVNKLLGNGSTQLNGSKDFVVSVLCTF